MYATLFAFDVENEGDIPSGSTRVERGTGRAAFSHSYCTLAEAVFAPEELRLHPVFLTDGDGEFIHSERRQVLTFDQQPSVVTIVCEAMDQEAGDADVVVFMPEGMGEVQDPARSAMLALAFDVGILVAPSIPWAEEMGQAAEPLTQVCIASLVLAAATSAGLHQMETDQCFEEILAFGSRQLSYALHGSTAYSAHLPANFPGVTSVMASLVNHIKLAPALQAPLSLEEIETQTQEIMSNLGLSMQEFGVSFPSPI